MGAAATSLLGWTADSAEHSRYEGPSIATVLVRQ